MMTFDEIFDLINERFKGKYRKASMEGVQIPAAIHSFAVLNSAIRYGIRIPWVLKAYACHDLLEDTVTSITELVEFIGDKATNVVIELTFRPDEMSKANYIESFRDKSIVAVVGKVVDRIENVEDFAISDPNYAGKYFHKADSVIANFFARRDEVTSMFGVEVTHNLQMAIHRLRERY